MPSLCIVVPCYNEAIRLDSEAFLQCLQEQSYTDLCFVNDGSSDGTAEVLAALQRRNPDRIHLLDLPTNGGKAEAVRRGCLHIRAQNRYDWLGYWDADLSTPLGDIQLLLGRRQEAEGDVMFVLASRIKRLGSEIERSSLRHVMGRVFATFASLLLRLPVYDSQCGAKLISPAGADIAFAEPFLSQWLFDVEILARLRNHFGTALVRDKVLEVPLRSWREKGNSRLRWSDYLRVPFELWKIARRYNATRGAPSPP